ncbi:hypoxanthine phosphoribosyltransferase [Natronincola ferrireducens]|uniref:Hypoxanthine phosphoribosyltransferase n=1 Tax=Natronincola ferrireducens TaxID=393762 RepID=A0A1G9EDI1_9FIRM|nr:hypoxanthine phosphoribosyltransferase [Natronincola ferrireducens]SDK74121.1 hypoxanthine phosphoribosyltransferase [Natronincola ferrireducens]
MDIEKKVWEVLCSEEDIKTRLKELGKQLSEDYKNRNLYIISLLKGSFIFTADLVRELTVPVKINFITTSSYGHDVESSGYVEILEDITEDLTGYDVLVVDDITDSALTMDSVVKHLEKKRPASIKSCVLLDKPERRKVEFAPDYVGFTIPDKFVVGYGLNFGDYYRNIPYVFVVTDQER